MMITTIIPNEQNSGKIPFNCCWLFYAAPHTYYELRVHTILRTVCWLWATTTCSIYEKSRNVLNFTSRRQWRERSATSLTSREFSYSSTQYSVQRNNNENWLPHIMTINPEHNVFFSSVCRERFQSLEHTQKRVPKVKLLRRECSRENHHLLDFIVGMKKSALLVCNEESIDFHRFHSIELETRLFFISLFLLLNENIGKLHFLTSLSSIAEHRHNEFIFIAHHRTTLTFRIFIWLRSEDP